jgi:hypothetical protein
MRQRQTSKWPLRDDKWSRLHPILQEQQKFDKTKQTLHEPFQQLPTIGFRLLIERLVLFLKNLVNFPAPLLDDPPSSSSQTCRHTHTELPTLPSRSQPLASRRACAREGASAIRPLGQLRL